MWKAKRFEGSDDKDPFEEMVEFINARHLQVGQFQFSVAADEEGYQYCLMLYSEAEPAGPRPPKGRPVHEAARPSPFAPADARGPQTKGSPRFKPGARGGRPSGGRGGERSGGGGGGPGRQGPGRGGRPQGGPRSHGDKRSRGQR